MAYILKNYLKQLKAANIQCDAAATGQFKGDYYVPAGKFSPHLHMSKDGTFVGLKKKQGAITTLVKDGQYNLGTIQGEIQDLMLEPKGVSPVVLRAARELLQQINA